MTEFLKTYIILKYVYLYIYIYDYNKVFLKEF